MAERIVVVGAGPAGTSCAEQLADHAWVTLIGSEPGQPYDRAALKGWLAGDLNEADLITHDADRLIDLTIYYRPGQTVARIDLRRSTVITETGASVTFDKLVLALGAEPMRPTLPGIDLPGVHTYRTRTDVNAMLAAARAGGHAIVIGDGPHGQQAAGGLAARFMRVSMLRSVGSLSQAGIAAISGDTRATGVRFADGTLLAADLVVLAAGTRPRTALAQQAGLAVGRGILVNGQMRTSHQAVFAIGACAEHDGVCNGLLPPALAQAAIAARALRADLGTDLAVGACAMAGAP